MKTERHHRLDSRFRRRTHLVAPVRAGARFERGVLVEREQTQAA
jgi:hypothetical protein